jgi:hypothetical protein
VLGTAERDGEMERRGRDSKVMVKVIVGNGKDKPQNFSALGDHDFLRSPGNVFLSAQILLMHGWKKLQCGATKIAFKTRHDFDRLILKKMIISFIRTLSFAIYNLRVPPRSLANTLFIPLIKSCFKSSKDSTPIESRTVKLKVNISFQFLLRSNRGDFFTQTGVRCRIGNDTMLNERLDSAERCGGGEYFKTMAQPCCIFWLRGDDGKRWRSTLHLLSSSNISPVVLE